MPHCCLLSKYFSLSRKFCKCVKAFPRSNGKGCGRQRLRLPSLSHGALCWGERMPLTDLVQRPITLTRTNQKTIPYAVYC